MQRLSQKIFKNKDLKPFFCECCHLRKHFEKSVKQVSKFYLVKLRCASNTKLNQPKLNRTSFIPLFQIYKKFISYSFVGLLTLLLNSRFISHRFYLIYGSVQNPVEFDYQAGGFSWVGLQIKDVSTLFHLLKKHGGQCQAINDITYSSNSLVIIWLSALKGAFCIKVRRH